MYCGFAIPLPREGLGVGFIPLPRERLGVGFIPLPREGLGVGLYLSDSFHDIFW